MTPRARGGLKLVSYAVALACFVEAGILRLCAAAGGAACEATPDAVELACSSSGSPSGAFAAWAGTPLGLAVLGVCFTGAGWLIRTHRQSIVDSITANATLAKEHHSEVVGWLQKVEDKVGATAEELRALKGEHDAMMRLGGHHGQPRGEIRLPEDDFTG